MARLLRALVALPEVLGLCPSTIQWSVIQILTPSSAPPPQALGTHGVRGHSCRQTLIHIKKK